MQPVVRTKAVKFQEGRGAKALMLTLLVMALVVAQTVVAFARPESLAPLAEKISPSVVNITTQTVVEGRTGPRGIVPEGSPFEDLFREFQDRNNPGENPSPRRSSALGSGFVISEDGFIVTNNHVIEGADEITIEFFSGEELKAELIGTDPNTDIALLKVEAPAPLPFVSFGNSTDARVGDWVIAMGNPLGQGFSVSAGIVSARKDVTEDIAEAMELESASGALITDVPEGPAKEAGLQTNDVIVSFDGVDVEDTRGLVRQVGNSPVGASVRVTVLRDGKSQTIKVVLGRREEADTAATSTAEEAPDEAPKTATLLGLTLTPLTEEMREELGAEADMEGLAVTKVDEESEAFEKGLRAGDIITEANQQKVAGIEDIQNGVEAAKEAGRKSLLLLVRRAGDPRFVALSLPE